ncbi:MAG: hypothetical protein SFY67_05855 [Candidatus Melainabacteria bacterium]|nr:hypothetical protein [Candidatus Melainabacteria bacterium]
MPEFRIRLSSYAFASALSICAASLALPAFADYSRGSDPNMGHFYMARQQIQITDDSPVINYKGGDPAQQQQQNPAMQQKRPAPLPKAGFNAYTPPPTASGYNPNLPSVENGVPRRELPSAGPALNHGDGVKRGPKGKQAKAGSLKPGSLGAQGKQANASPGGFNGPTKTYAPYKGYDPNNSPISSSYSSSSANNQQVKTKVRGALTFGRQAK